MRGQSRSKLTCRESTSSDIFIDSCSVPRDLVVKRDEPGNDSGDNEKEASVLEKRVGVQNCVSSNFVLICSSLLMVYDPSWHACSRVAFILCRPTTGQCLKKLLDVFRHAGDNVRVTHPTKPNTSTDSAIPFLPAHPWEVIHFRLGIMYLLTLLGVRVQ